MSRTEMNRDPINTILAGALLLSVLATAGMCYWYLQATRQLRTAQHQMIAVNRNRALMQQFAGHAVEYSRHNPAILPILENAGIRSRVPAGESQTNSPAE